MKLEREYFNRKSDNAIDWSKLIGKSYKTKPILGGSYRWGTVMGVENGGNKIILSLSSNISSTKTTTMVVSKEDIERYFEII